MANHDTSLPIAPQEGTGTITESHFSLTNLEAITSTKDNETWISNLQKNGNKPEEWLAYLRHLENSGTSKQTEEHLLFLDQAYRKARENIPIGHYKDNEACAEVFNRSAHIKQELNMPDKARFLFRFLRANMKYLPSVYLPGAQFELDQGDKSKCLYILEKGLKITKDARFQTAITRVESGFSTLEAEQGIISPPQSGENHSPGVKDSGLKQIPCTIDNGLNDDRDSVLQIHGAAPSFGTRGPASAFRKIDKSTSHQNNRAGEVDVIKPKPVLATSFLNSVPGSKTHQPPTASSIHPNPIPVSSLKPSYPVSATNGDQNHLRHNEKKSIQPVNATPHRQALKQPCETPQMKVLPLVGTTPSVGATPQCRVPAGIEHVDSTISFRRPGPSSRNRNSSGNSDEGDTMPLPASGPSYSSVFSETRRSANKPVVQASVRTKRPNRLPQRVTRQDVDHDEDEDDEESAHVPPPIHRLDSITEDRDSGVSVNTPPYDENIQPFFTPLVPQQTPNSSESHATSGAKHAMPKSSATSITHSIEPAKPPLHSTAPRNTHSQKSKGESSNKQVIVVNSKRYQKLAVLGKGGSSVVYKVMDPAKCVILAVKYVSLALADQQTIDSYKNEITLLQRLQDKEPIIKLYDHEITRDYIYIVMECGSSDLASFLKKKKVEKMFIPFYWTQMLQAVQCIHDEGIIHRDLKPANFLFVDASLKLIDFGIANAIQMDADSTSIIKHSQMGTLNYMSPEAIRDTSTPQESAEQKQLRIKINRKTDVWSLGCILYYMMYGRTPFQHITNTLLKLHAICDDKQEIEFPDFDDKVLQETVKSCLIRDVTRRPSIQELLTTIRKRMVTVSKEPCTPPPPVMDAASSLMSQLNTNTNSPGSLELAVALKKYLKRKGEQSEESSHPALRHPLHDINSYSVSKKEQGLPFKLGPPSRSAQHYPNRKELSMVYLPEVSKNKRKSMPLSDQ